MKRSQIEMLRRTLEIAVAEYERPIPEGLSRDELRDEYLGRFGYVGRLAKSALEQLNAGTKK